VSLSAVAVPRRAVLADALPRSRARDVVLVFGAALFTALCAQFEIPVPGSPVPVSGQTFAIILGAAALGAHRGTLAMALYVLLGAVGLPFYSGGDGGVQHLWGATGGYIFGFIVAAWVVGKLAERGQDRTFLRAAPAFAAGQLVIFGLGVPWLAVSADLSASEAIAAGFTPFIVGGIVKAALAGALLPSAWRLVGRR